MSRNAVVAALLFALACGPAVAGQEGEGSEQGKPAVTFGVNGDHPGASYAFENASPEAVWGYMRDNAKAAIAHAEQIGGVELGEAKERLKTAEELAAKGDHQRAAAVADQGFRDAEKAINARYLVLAQEKAAAVEKLVEGNAAVTADQHEVLSRAKAGIARGEGEWAYRQLDALAKELDKSASI